jgi:hypothetical protein
MDSDVCDVCGHELEPDGLDNPDLNKAKDLLTQDGADVPDEAAPVPGEPTSYLRDQMGETNNLVPTANVRSDMAWRSFVHPKVAGRINTVEQPVKPSGTPAPSNEPQETIIRDETAPVTQRTASDLIAAATQGAAMADDATRVAAEPADSSGDAKKRVDVTGVGGVDQATNEQASKADAQVDVQGKGGTGVEDVDADEHQNVETEADTTDSGPTKTFPKGKKDLDAGSVHDDQPFPKGGAKKGTDPVDPVGKPDERVDLEQEVSVSWNQSQTGTDQWTGTGGNGVTRQQDPVTRKVDPNITVSFTSKVAKILRLADTEVELGLAQNDQKYDRIAELENVDESIIDAQLEAFSRVKSAGLKKAAGNLTREAHRVPRLARTTGDEEAPTPSYSEGELDTAVFTR